MKIKVDQDKCIGCNMCEDISEGAVGCKYGVDGRAGVNPDIDLTDSTVIANVKLAAETCPVQGISVEE
jgi:ferredoxin